MRPVRNVLVLIEELQLKIIIRSQSFAGSVTSTLDERADAAMEFLTKLESSALDTMSRTSPLYDVRIAVISTPSVTGSKAFLTSSWTSSGVVSDPVLALTRTT